MSNLLFNGDNSALATAQVDVIPTIDTVDFHREYPFTTLDFFPVDEGNRPSDESDSTVKSYAKQMINGQWFEDCSTIYVSIHTKKILNGENRRKAYNLAKEKGYNPIIWVKFIDDSEKPKEKREALNGGRHWNCDDCCNSLVSEGNKDYIFLKKFAINEDHPQLHSSKGKPNWNKAAIVLGVTYREFKDGYKKRISNFTREGIARAERTYSEMVRIKKALKYDGAGQDCWISFGEAWQMIINNKVMWNRIKSLPEGIEDFYDALKYVDNTNSNKPLEWYERFVYAIEKAEKTNK